MFVSHFSSEHLKSKSIDLNSPELAFIRNICSGSPDCSSFFVPETACQTRVFLDAPSGRFTGLSEIELYAKSFLKMADAVSAEVYPLVQTRAGGRSVTEMEVRFKKTDSSTLRIPMAVFGDLSPDGKLEGMRIYYFYQWIPGTPAYRKPIFRPTDLKNSSPSLLTGVVRYYYEQLHNFYSAEALEKIMEMTSENIRYGGYRPEEAEPLIKSKDDFYKMYQGITSGIPQDQYIRFETITDDGITCAVEWTSVIRKSGLEKGIVSQAGMAAYRRDEKGKLVAVRICDNLGWEKDIDRNMVLPENMFIAND